jgi:hypothetical protein
MRFRLTYEGELKATQRDAADEQIKPDRLAEHKMMIRRNFHRQLRHLWDTNKFLREHKINPDVDLWSKITPGSGELWVTDKERLRPMREVIPLSYQYNGFKYPPLVRSKWSLLCSLEIIFLRRDIPGSIISAGDIDNRIKTLIDSLRIPKNRNELPTNVTPEADEHPFYVLLEDDNQVSGLAVETDTLLDPPRGPAAFDQREVKLIITVDIRPYDVNMFNLSFA